MLARLGLACAAFVLGGACTLEPTQLVVVVSTDLDVPGELDELEIEVEGRGVLESRGPIVFEGETPASLPASFGVAPKDGDPDRRVTVRVRGRVQGRDHVETYARTGFVEHERLRLDIFLARRCIQEGVECEAQGLTCTQDGCTNPSREPEDLPRWDGTLLPPDGPGRCPEEEPMPGIVAWTSDPATAIAAADAASLPDGGAVVLGTFVGAVAFADGSCSDESTGGLFLARLLADGSVSWVRSLAGPGVEVSEPLVAVDGTDGESILVAFGLHATSLVIGGRAYGDDNDGVLLRLDPGGTITAVLEIRSDSRWEAVALSSDESGVALVGTARGQCEVDGLQDPTAGWFGSNSTVAIRWPADLSQACIAAFGAAEDVPAVSGTLYAGGVLAVSGSWSGEITLVGRRFQADASGSIFTIGLDDDCSSRWLSPTTQVSTPVHRLSPFGAGGGGLLKVSQRGAGDADLVSLTAEGVSDEQNVAPFESDWRITALERVGDVGALVAGVVVGADPPAGWLSRLELDLVASSVPTRLSVAVDAAAVDPTSQTVLVAGAVTGRVDVEGFGAVGTPGRRQIYALRLPLPLP